MNSQPIDQRLNEVAEAGDIDALYGLIQQDAKLLERINEIPFIDTPLHIAASAGNIDFAMEIMNLKSSFARKLNPDGFSPMHLALKNNQDLIVIWLLDMDPGLVRLKGKGGITPLHQAAEQGNLSVLQEFFEGCPESIKDVTFQGDTALHIAVKTNKIEAFEVLMGWLHRSFFVDAAIWERELLNWKNKEGNTILHIAALNNQLQVIKQLTEAFVYTDIRNSNGLTAMAILKDQGQFNNQELSKMRKLPPFGYRTPVGRTGNLKKKLSFCNKWAIRSARRKTRIPNERRNALLVVDALIATITYQAALSPPGGVWQGIADINSHLPNILRYDISTTTTNTTSTPLKFNSNPSRYVGSSIMDSHTFFLFWFANTAVYFSAITRMLKASLVETGSIRTVAFPVFAIFSRPGMLLFSGFSLSMSVVSPTKALANFNLFFFLIIATAFVFVMVIYYILYPRGFIGFHSSWSRVRKRMHQRKEWW